MNQFGDGRDWFFKSRYGLFIHWGPYSINGWHEQEQWRRSVPRDEYSSIAKTWNPHNYDPET